MAGEQHHFIFPLQGPLRAVLQWQGRGKLLPIFSRFLLILGQWGKMGTGQGS